MYFKEPQLYIFNNEQLANVLKKDFVVEEGNIGLHKKITYKDSYAYVGFERRGMDNFHEFKVHILDLQKKPPIRNITQDDYAGNYPKMFCVKFPQREFKATPLGLTLIASKMSKGTLRIVFAGENDAATYNIGKFTATRRFEQHDTKYNWVYDSFDVKVNNKSGNKFKVVESGIADIIMKYTEGYCVTFDFYRQRDASNTKWVYEPNCYPLLTNMEDEVISYLRKNRYDGYDLVLPLCSKKEELIRDLLTKDLPQLFPEIFPESTEHNWIKDEEFCSDEFRQYEEEKRRLEEDFERQMQELNDKQKMAEEKYEFLKKLITETGDELVVAVKEYLEYLGFDTVKTMDNEEETLREDIQVIDGNDLYIIEIKGLQGTSTDSECAQIAKHRRRREKEYPGYDVHPIYIVNHQRHLRPQMRQNPPFSKDQIEYAENDERGLLTTWQLYKQYKLIEEGIFSKVETREALKGYGNMSLIPKTLNEIGTVTEYFKNHKACIINIENTLLKVGDELCCSKNDEWKKGTIISLQDEGKDVEEIQDGEIGMVLDTELGVGYKIYKK